MSSTKARSISLQIADIQLDFNMRTNDTQIFVNQIIDIVSAKAVEAGSEPPKARRRYHVLRTGPMRRVSRSMPNIAEMYRRYAERDIYVAFLNDAVARFESFLADALRIIFFAYPNKITLNFPGISPLKSLPIDSILGSASKEDIISLAVETHLNNVFYSGAKTYIKYTEEIIGAKFMEKHIEQYVEVKATRDLLTHGAGIVNHVYLAKAGRHAREVEGNIIPVSSDYFDSSLSVMKTIAGFVRRDARKTFGR